MARSTGILRVVRKSGAVRWRARWIAPGGKRRSEVYASEAAARAGLRRRQVETDDVRSGLASVPLAGATTTVSAYAERWKEGRTGRFASAEADARRLGHIVPRLGSVMLADLRPRHIRDAILALRQESKLAPRSIRSSAGALRTLLRSAVTDELILASPFVLDRGVMPPNVDRDPGWRATAVFSRDELERLMSDDAIPHDRRVLYALFGLAGLRLGEAAGLRWSHYDAAAEPMGRLYVNQSYGRPGTKTGVSREVPVHPALAAVLAAWRLGGWARIYGRPPKTDDLIIPTRRGNMVNRKGASEARARDCAALGIRRRRGHDLRRTFISLAQADGALPHVLERITHGPRGDILNMYTTWPWAALCAEVAKLRASLRTTAVVMPLVSVA